MKVFKKHGKSLVLYRFLICYGFVFLIPLFMIIYIYSDLYKSTLELACKDQLSLTDKAGTVLDSYFIEIEKVSYQLNTDYYINQVIQFTDPYNDSTMISDIYRLSPMLSSYLTTNNYMKEIQIYLQKSKSVITNSTSYLQLEMLYDPHFKSTYKSFSEWEKNYLNQIYKHDYKSNFPLKIDNVNQDYLIYSHTFTNSTKDNIANIFIYIDQSMMLAPLNNVTGIETGFSLLCDGEKNYISNSTIEKDTFESIYSKCSGESGYFIEKINDKNMLITFSYAAKANGFYITAVSEEFVLQGLRNVKLLFAFIMSITIFVGAIFIIWFAYKNSRPIVGLIDVLDKNQMLENVNYSAKFINQEVLKVIKKNQTLTQKAANQIPSMKIALLYKLLNGNIGNVNELLNDFEQLGIRLEGTYFGILIMTINDINIESKIGEISAYHTIITQQASTAMAGFIGTYDIDLENSALIISSHANNYVDFISELESEILKIKQYVKKQMNIDISFSGSITNSVQKIPRCYYEARVASGYDENLNHMEILWYNKAKKTDDKFFSYSIQTETELIQYITDGNYEFCDKLLQDIYKQNFKTSNISKSSAAQLLHSLSATLVRCMASSCDISDDSKDKVEHLSSYLNQSREPKESFEYIAALSLEICKKNQRVTTTKSLIDDVLTYINDIYSDNQLSLSLVAERFNITEIYLSRFFKEKTGENFSKYIENLRMKKAKELLIQNCATIKTISEMVGYNSPQVFRRVYKKYYGELPSQHQS